MSDTAIDVRGDAAAARTSARDRYIDTLRAVALFRVVTYHQFGWHWLPLAYPSMGIMFALAGGLVARSLTRAEGNHWTVLGRRLRRLLPPLWLFGLVIIPVMVVHGWTATTTGGGDPLRQWRLFLFWLVPIGNPPGSDWGYDFVLPLWYIRTYLWLLLLSPALLFLFRRWPKRVLAVPLGIVAAATFGVIDLSSGRAAAAVLDFGIYGACWMLGFAHEDGHIRTIPLWKVVPTGLGLLAGGLAWAFTHQTDTGWDIDNIPAASALYCLGAVLLLMRFYPSFTWMSRFPVLDGAVAMISSRAMTIYLWHNFAIFLAVPVLDSNRYTANLDSNSAAGDLARFGTALLLTLAATFLFGWAEDLAARRRPRFNPWPRGTRRAELEPSAPGRPRFVPLRNRPGLLAAGLVVAAALTTGAVLSPWSHDSPPSTAERIGRAVTPYPGSTSAQPRLTRPRPPSPAPVVGHPPGNSSAPSSGTAPGPARTSMPSSDLAPSEQSRVGSGSTTPPPSSSSAVPSRSTQLSSRPTPTPTGGVTSSAPVPETTPLPTPTATVLPSTVLPSTVVPTLTPTPTTPLGVPAIGAQK